MRLQERTTRQRTVRRAHAPRTTLVVCVVCGAAEPEQHARLGAWQFPRDGLEIHCASCADDHAVRLDDVVLYWPGCGHAGEHGEVLYDRTVCLVCAGG